MKPIVRFAPSPTGLLHIGNARTALINWLFARHHKGTFIFRLDDTDLARSKPEYTKALIQDLKWLGINYDAYYAQSERLLLYDTAVTTLKQSGRLYACYETQEELEFKRRLQRTQGLPPLYDRAGLNLTQANKDKFDQEGRKPHWRFLLKDEAVSWCDLSRGDLRFDPHTMSDPVLLREDGSPVYTLSSVVDDIDLKITHVLRGEDHISNTAVQIQLFQALGGNPELLTFAHFPLLVGEQGEGLSKRLGSLTLQSLKEQGIESLAVARYLTKLGTSESIVPASTISELIEDFDVSHFGRASPRFSLTDLERFNGKILHQTSYADISSRLNALGLDDIDEKLWQTFQGNINKIQDIIPLMNIVRQEIDPQIADLDYIKIALECLPAAPWDTETWAKWTQDVKGKTGRKGKDLFMPLRLALTAEAHGPEMKELLPLIGYDKALKRLQGYKA